MSETSRAINRFFATSTKDEVDGIIGNVVLSERQETIFKMFYLKKNDMGFIADTLNTSTDTVKKELQKIRAKLSRLI